MTNESSFDPKLLQIAIQHQEAGRLPEATRIYSEILAVEPTNIDALHLSGLIAYESGKLGIAEKLFRRALLVDSNVSNVHNSLGLVLHDLKQHQSAIECFEAAISLNPDATQGFNNLGNLLQDVERYNEAIAVYQRVIELEPGHTAARFNMANAFRNVGNLPLAEEQYKALLEVAPDFVDAAVALSRILIAAQRLDDAELVLKEAVVHSPDNYDLNCQLGGCLLAREEPQLATHVFLKATQSKPKSGQAWFGLACAHMESEDFAAAIPSFRLTLSIDPNHTETHQNLGRCYFEMGRVDEAVAEFRAAMSPVPVCPALVALATVIPSAPSADNQQILEARKTLGYRIEKQATTIELPPIVRTSRIRIGYLSSRFDDVYRGKQIAGLLRNHDREQFEIHWFCDAESTASLNAQVDSRDVVHATFDLSNDDFYQSLAKAELDILVDLNDLRTTRRLPILAASPVPVMVGLGSIATRGMNAFQYVVADEHVVPEDEDRFYSERVIRVPGTHLNFHVDYPVPNIVEPPCRKNGSITFGSLAAQHKITPHVIKAWAEILNGCPDCQLLLRNPNLASKPNREYVRDAFRAYGVDPDRIQLSGPAAHYQFLQTYDHIDIVLDTFPHNGGSTTIEALWQGVPVLTYYGDRWASRTTASILRNAFLDEYVAESRREYVDQAVALAYDQQTPDRLAELRSAMRERIGNSPAGDAKAHTQFLESEFRRMLDIK